MNRLYTYLVPYLFVSLFLFITVSLIYDHYERGYRFTNRLWNQTFFIERALERIPICNENDHLRHRTLLYTFQTWSQLAQMKQLRYWIAYKTLAAYVRYHDLAPYDRDIDVFIMAEDTPKLIELMKSNYSSMYKLKVHPQWFISKVSNRSKFPSEGIDFTTENARFVHLNSSVSINIWPVYTNDYKKTTLMLVQYLDVDSWILSPIEWTFPLEPCVFSGIQVWCPARPKKLTNS